jgi:hypothetical protein
MDWNSQGAGQGAAAGAAGGNPFSAVMGGLIGGLMGGDGPTDVDDLLPRIDATSEANKVLGQTNIFNRQMSGVQGGASNLGDATTKKLIAAGIDPAFAAKAGAEAQYKALTAGTGNVADQSTAMYSQQLGNFQQIAHQRDDDRASYTAQLDADKEAQAMQMMQMGVKGMGQMAGPMGSRLAIAWKKR